MRALHRWYRNRANDAAVSQWRAGREPFVTGHGVVLAAVVVYPTLMIVSITHADPDLIAPICFAAFFLGMLLGGVSVLIARRRVLRARRTGPPGRRPR